MLDRAGLLLVLSNKPIGSCSSELLDSPCSPYWLQPFCHISYLTWTQISTGKNLHRSAKKADYEALLVGLFVLLLLKADA